jgi:hypothetical protein
VIKKYLSQEHAAGVCADRDAGELTAKKIGDRELGEDAPIIADAGERVGERVGERAREPGRLGKGP